MHVLQPPPGLSEPYQHRPELEADLEALLQRGRALRERREDPQRLLEPDPGRRERRPRGRLEAGLAEIGHRLLVQFAPEGVKGQPLDLLPEAIAVERLDRVDDSRVKAPSPLLQQAPVRDVVGERVLEGVLAIRIESGLIEELGGLQSDESLAERLVSAARRSPGASANGTSVPTTEATCRRRLSSWEQSVDARRQYRLDRGWDPDSLDRLRQPIPTSFPRQCLRLHQHPDSLLQEERVPPLDEELLERRESRIVAEEHLEQLPGALGRERVQPHLTVGRLAAPGVLVLGSVGDQQQQAGRPQASTRLSSRACVSASIQCRSSKTRTGGCT